MSTSVYKVVIDVRTAIQESILQLLQERRSSYAHPVNSQTISEALNITPSYVREQMGDLQKQQLAAVRRGPKGGYYHMTTSNTLRLQIDETVTEFAAGTFASVYPRVVEQLNEQGQIIVHISLNGVEVLPTGVDAVPGGDVEEVLIRTESMEQFAFDLITTADEYLPKLKEGLVTIASLYQSGKEDEANSLFAEAVDGLGWTESCLSGLGQWAMTRGDQKLLGIHDAYQSQLAQLSEAMEAQNLTEFSDLLEYELAETVGAAHSNLLMLRDQIKSVGRE